MPARDWRGASALNESRLSRSPTIWVRPPIGANLSQRPQMTGLPGSSAERAACLAGVAGRPSAHIAAGHHKLSPFIGARHRPGLDPGLHDPVDPGLHDPALHLFGLDRRGEVIDPEVDILGAPAGDGRPSLWPGARSRRRKRIRACRPSSKTSTCGRHGWARRAMTLSRQGAAQDDGRRDLDGGAGTKEAQAAQKLGG